MGIAFYVMNDLVIRDRRKMTLEIFEFDLPDQGVVVEIGDQFTHLLDVAVFRGIERLVVNLALLINTDLGCADALDLYRGWLFGNARGIVRARHGGLAKRQRQYHNETYSLHIRHNS